MSAPVVRFAPSPTGYLHIGNLRTALFNWLYAKEQGRAGRFVLRYDDTDRERSRAEYAEAIAADLDWLGIRPDAAFRQSERLQAYGEAATRLREAGVLYPCYETPDELDIKRKRLVARGLPPVYAREALRLTAADRAGLEAEGCRPYWRFLLPNFATDPFEPRRTEMHWHDLVLGEQTVDLGSLSDPVLIRADGAELYTFTSVVDDGETGITHVIRGGDHITNTGVQIALFEALGHTVPTFGHHNLLTTIDGEGLSKRSGALSLRSLREAGMQPMAVASLAVLTGMAGSIEAAPTLAELGRRLDLAAVSASASKFDPVELDRLSAELTHRLEPEEVRVELEAMGVPPETVAPFWLAVRANCAKVADAAAWWRIVAVDLGDGSAMGEDDRRFAHDAFGLLPREPWDAGTWKVWTDAVKAASGRKGKALFMPLRLALTGLDHGPELAALLPLIGRERTLARRP